MREFHQGKTELYTKGLLAVAALLGALTCLRVAEFSAASSQGRDVAAAALDSGARDAGAANDVSTLLASSRATAEDLKKKNLFVPAVPKQHPVSGVLGILGDEALIDGKWYKAGDRVGEAKLLAIEPTKVRIAWNGQEKDFYPIAAETGGPADRAGRPGAGDRSAMRGNAPTAAGGPAIGRPALSEAERSQRREQWQKMSPEERQRAREEMRQRLGARAR